MDNVFSFMLSTIDGFLQNFVTNGVAAMTGSVGGLFAALGGVYLALYGWAVMFGHAQASLADLGRKVFALALVYTFAASGVAYGVVLTELFWNLPESVAGVLLGLAGEASTADVRVAGDVPRIEALVERYSLRVDHVTERIADSGRVVPDVIAAVLALCMYVPLIAASFIVLISKVGLALMLVFGPLAILGSLFGWTRGLFEGWLRQSLTFVTTAVFAYAVIALLVSVLDSFAGELIVSARESGIAWTQGIPLALLAIVAAIVFLQVPQFSAGLVGGIGIGDLGAVQWAGQGAARGARATGARTGRAVGRATQSAAARIAPKLPPALTARLSAAGQAAQRGGSAAAYLSGARHAKPSPARSSKS